VGTGLGLWICEGIVASLGGTIRAASEPGRETVFRVELPARAASAPPSARTPSDPHAVIGRRGRILIVDDEAPLARVLANALAAEHETVVVTSGRDAQSLLRKDTEFDVILCDLMMPDVSGMDLYEELRKTAPAVAARVVFVTGGAFTHRAREFLEAASVERIEKPFDMDKLRRLLRMRIGQGTRQDKR
jgi:CheY-like chemotaxis protein